MNDGTKQQSLERSKQWDKTAEKDGEDSGGNGGKRWLGSIKDD